MSALMYNIISYMSSKIMFDLSAQALKRLELMRYIMLKLNYSINNLIVVTIDI